MTVEETEFFNLLDGYARNRHACFVSEMFLTAGKTDYTLCFRPAGRPKDSPNRYACRYLHIEEVEEVRTAGQKQVLPASITEMLDRELSQLPQS
jgi:hypothetical protein